MEKQNNSLVLFIESITNNVKDNHSQSFYDSRNKQNDVFHTPIKKETSLIKKKLEGIMKMKTNNDIYLIVITKDKTYEGVLKALNGDDLIITKDNIDITIKQTIIEDIYLG